MELIICTPDHINKGTHEKVLVQQGLISRIVAKGGQSIWQLNYLTGIIKELQFEPGEKKRKIIFDPTYLYCPAVNKVNADRKFKFILKKLNLDAGEKTSG